MTRSRACGGCCDARACGACAWIPHSVTPTLDPTGAARILDLAESRGSRKGALAGFAVILLVAAHAALAGGSPKSAQAAAMSPAGAEIHARESAQMNRLMAFSAAAVVTAGASAQNAVQWRVEDGGNGHWYATVSVAPMPMTVQAMSAFAMSKGANLASIHSSAENQFALSLLQGIGSGESFASWIGLYRSVAGDPWRWTDGSEMGWAGWGGTACLSGPYPNDLSNSGELGVMIYRQDCGLVWDDSATAWINSPPPWWGGIANMTLMLEWSADCNNDGIVDYGQIRSGELADANANNIPDCCESGTPCNCAGDTNNDGFVDGIDLATILTRWAQPATKFPNADCNHDGVIDGSDLSIVLGSWGVCP